MIVPTYTAQIYIAGDIAIAKQLCREHCLAIGLCVTVEVVDYIYTGGEEAGVRVGLINYPKFPSTPDEIWRKATALAERLLVRLCQHSYTIVASDRTEWSSNRQDATPSQAFP